MKTTTIKNSLFAFILGFGLFSTGCSSSDEQQEEDYVESSDEEEAAEAADGIEQSEEEAMQQEAGEQGEDGYVASEEGDEEAEETVEEPTLPEEIAIAEEVPAEMPEAGTEEVAETTDLSAPAGNSNWAPEGNSGESFDYVIKKGDTVSGVARLVYGSTSQWREISSATGLDNPDLIFPGSILKIPLLNEQSRQFNESYASQPSIDGEEVSVTVEEGDTLSSIAESELGDSTNWPHIYGQNRGSISDPDMIRVGQVLTFGKNQAH